MQLQVGNTIDDRYEIVRQLARGGFAVVYLAYQKQFDRTVAVKVLDKYALTESDAFARFELEAKAASALRHKNIVGVYGFGVWHEAPYMVLEYVDGVSLHELIRRNHSLSPTRTAAIGVQICEALELAHNTGIIHRDLKPSNIMITTTPDDGDLVKIIDFGLAKLMPGFGLPAQKLTETGAALGTCTYMAPEQCTGQPLDRRADIYSLGCILYECATGEPPFVADNNVAIMFMHMNNQHGSIDDTNGTDPNKRRLNEIVRKALAKDSDRRYATAQEIRADLHAMLAGNEPTYAKDAPPEVQQPFTTKPKSRKRTVLFAIVTALAILLFGSALWQRLTTKLPDDRHVQSSIDLYRITYNDGHPWDPKMGNRKAFAMQTLVANERDRRLDAHKLTDIYNIIAGEERQLNNWNKAYEYNEIAIKYGHRHDPNDPNGFTQLLVKADCLYHMGHRQDAMKLVDEVLAAPVGRYDQSSPSQAYFQLASFADEEGRYDDFITYMRKASAPNHDASAMRHARLSLAEMLIIRGRALEAQGVLNEALQWPGDQFLVGDLNENMLRCLEVQGKWKEAMTLRTNMHKYQTPTPHGFNIMLMTLSFNAHNLKRYDTWLSTECLCNTSGLAYDRYRLCIIDKNIATRELKAAGYNDLLKRLYDRFPDWNRTAK